MAKAIVIDFIFLSVLYGALFGAAFSAVVYWASHIYRWLTRKETASWTCELCDKFTIETSPPNRELMDKLVVSHYNVNHKDSSGRV